MIAEDAGQPISNRTDPLDDRLRLFLQVQRSNPYYVLMTVLFGAMFARIAVWIGEIFYARHDHPSVQYDWFGLLLASFAFFLTLNFWLYFSRVLIYLRETAGGEQVSALVALASLVVISCLHTRAVPWPFALSGWIFALAVKYSQVALSLRSRRNHPLYSISVAGARVATAQVVLGMAIGFYVSRSPNVSSEFALLFAATVFAFFVNHFNLRRLTDQVRIDMLTYAQEDAEALSLYYG